MNKTFKRIIAFMAALLVMASMYACTKPNTVEPGTNDQKNSTPGPVIDPSATSAPTIDPAVLENVVKVTFTVDARAAYECSDLPAEVKAQLVGNGLLMNNAQITLPKGSKLISTFRVLDISGIPIVFENGLVTSLKGVANGSCGENSCWLLKINGEVVEGNIEEIVLNNGDEIVFVYDLEAGPASTSGSEPAETSNLAGKDQG